MNRRICLFVIALLIVALAYLLPGCDTLVTEKTVIIEAGHPIADFSADLTNGCDSLTVQFTDESSGPRQLWSWYFGDGDSSNDTNPSHLYDSSGVYTVMLTIRDTTVQDTGQDTEVKNAYIIVGTAVSDIEVSDTVGCPGTEVTFMPLDTGGVATYEWDFGDESPTSSEPGPTHVYTDTGHYTVTLTVTGTECPAKMIEKENLIRITICPEVAFSAAYPDDTIPLSEGCKPLTVDFQDESVPSEGEVMDTWHWDFGDGHQESGSPDVTHEYKDTTGTFIVTLTASSGGPEVTATDTIRVYDSTTAAFIAESPTSSCYWPGRQFQVKFMSQSLGKIDTMIWHFGDGDTLYNDSNPIHAYDLGIYICSLEVYGICGIDTMADTFVMEDSVILADVFDTVIFSITPPTGDTSTTFTFTDESEGIILSRQWIIGTVIKDNAPKEVDHKFSEPGLYFISLTIRNNCDTAEVIYSVDVSEPE